MRYPAVIFAALLAAVPAHALDVNVIGLFPGKAVVVVNRGAPRTLSVGQRTPEGVLLVAVDSTGAVVEIDGKRERVDMGQHFETAAQSASRTTTTVASDERGHYNLDGSINGAHTRFLVDTGATLVSISAGDAERIGIDYLRGRRTISVMADGRRVATYNVQLDSVTAGEITLYNVEASVHQGPGTGYALLGMSFLARTEMRREGPNLTLTKRY
jgi:aspartyl protease family protein